MSVGNRLRRFLRRRDGASAAEYALVLALLGAGIVGALWALNGNVVTAMSDIGNDIQGPLNGN